jgi:hypothetical protein
MVLLATTKLMRELEGGEERTSPGGVLLTNEDNASARDMAGYML